MLSVQYVNDASSVCYIPSIIFIHFSLSSSVRGKVTLMPQSGFLLPSPLVCDSTLRVGREENAGFSEAIK